MNLEFEISRYRSWGLRHSVSLTTPIVSTIVRQGNIVSLLFGYQSRVKFSFR